MQGFIIGGLRTPHQEFREEMGRWVQEGKIHYREQVTDGLENAPDALIGLLEGKTLAKS